METNAITRAERRHGFAAPHTTERDIGRLRGPAWDWPALVAHCHAVARRCTSSPHDAEDAAQEAAARAWRYRRQCRRHPDPRAWLAVIVRREVARLAAERSRTHEAPVAELPEAGEGGSAIAEVTERLWVRSALGSLSPDDRTLIGLRYEDDLTQPSIAARTGLPEGTVKVRLHRARATLRACLEAA